MKHSYGIFGAGAIAEVHARAINSIEDAVLTGVYDIHPDRTLSFSKKYNCKPFGSPEELVSDKNIDIVCVCTPSGEHLNPALLSIKAGKHCIIEKPLEVTLDRCDIIIEQAAKNNVMVSGIFPMRFTDIGSDLKKCTDSGRFGKYILGDVYVKWYRKPEYYSDVKWRGSAIKCGGGALMNQAIHSVDLLQWYMGKVESVNAFTALISHENIEVEDTAVAILRFSNGALGVIEASTAVNPGFFRRIEILGSKGSVVVEEEKILTWKFDNEREEDEHIRRKYSGNNVTGGGVSDPKAISDTGHIRQFIDITSAIDRGVAPAIDAEEARKAVEIVLAVYRSANEKRVVYL
ncbi:MAG: Gfo/Idh/MocA family oxidoreductase [Bacteroidales bacterium]|nr:Gfo/Idh/MocA family oxidoreductase [Bacteroidales bacterium]